MAKLREVAGSERASSLTWDLWSLENVCCRTGFRRSSEEYQCSAATNQE
jgi:hypothetical protein